MSRFASLIVACVALSACIDGGAGRARSRCGRSYVTDVYWAASVGAAGSWYGSTGVPDGTDYYGDWYDPGDAAYDPGTNSGGIGPDPNADDGSGWNQPDDSSSADPGADPSADPGSSDPGAADTSGGDTSGGDTSGGDSSGLSIARLHLHSAATAVSPAAPSGCYACTMGCRTDVTASAAGRQAIGVSDTSYDDACSAAVHQLAQWSHDTHREKLGVCQRIAAP
ncbi:MAG: hypothetical protein JWO86_4652 [Myxococcaceae bacterium]|nr:hypothetical protein [Myxococcaceae bacterium]